MTQGTTDLNLGISVVHMSSRELKVIYLQYSCFKNIMLFESFSVLLLEFHRGILRVHAGKACIRAIVSRVRIPFSPPLNYTHTHLIRVKFIRANQVLLFIRWWRETETTLSTLNSFYRDYFQISSFFY